MLLKYPYSTNSRKPELVSPFRKPRCNTLLVSYECSSFLHSQPMLSQNCHTDVAPSCGIHENISTMPPPLLEKQSDLPSVKRSPSSETAISDPKPTLIAALDGDEDKAALDLSTVSLMYLNFKLVVAVCFPVDDTTSKIF